MSVRRVMGIETEYGILDATGRLANPMLLSSRVVLSYRELVRDYKQAKWDYRFEDPLQDARGHRLQRAAAHPSMLTDDPLRPAASGPTAIDVDHPGAASVQSAPRPVSSGYEDPGAANSVLTNGGRLYVDHAHPEYSSPETLTPTDALLWDRAGEIIMDQAARAANLQDQDSDVVLYKNNTDGKGASYGTHENYLVRREVAFADLVAVLTPFLVTRQVFAGSGRVGLGTHGQQEGFQLSQRADFMEAEVGLETTLRRPIINTRDEPHCDPARWRRLHLIIGDANLFEVATWLKLGTTSLVLAILEHANSAQLQILRDLRLLDPVSAVQQVSRDLSLSQPIRLHDGRELTALQIQQTYLEVAKELVAQQDPSGPDAETWEILATWEKILLQLASDATQCARQVEWVAKLQLLERMRSRDALAWSHPRLAAFDLQWSDIRPERGIYQRLRRAGAVDTLVSEAAGQEAIHNPPQETRAYFRGRTVAKFGAELAAASWESVVFDLPESDQLSRVIMADPHRGTSELVGELLDNASTASELLHRLKQDPQLMNN